MRAALEGLNPDVRGRREEGRGVERRRRLAGRRLLLNLLDPRRLRDVLVGALRPRLILEALGLVADGEGLTVLQVHLKLPVRFRDEGAPLALAVRYKDQGRRLDAPDREEGAPVTFRGARDPAGQGCAPDQVYILPSLAGIGQVVGDLEELVEGASDLAWRERGEPGALDVVRELRVRLEDQGERLHPDQLPLAVEVRGDNDTVGLLGERGHGLGHALLGDGFEDLGVYELPRLDFLPVGVLLGVLGVQDVPLEPDGDRLLPFPHKRVVGHGAVLALLHRILGEELGDLLRCVCFLRDN